MRFSLIITMVKPFGVFLNFFLNCLLHFFATDEILTNEIPNFLETDYIASSPQFFHYLPKIFLPVFFICGGHIIKLLLLVFLNRNLKLRADKGVAFFKLAFGAVLFCGGHIKVSNLLLNQAEIRDMPIGHLFF